MFITRHCVHINPFKTQLNRCGVQIGVFNAFYSKNCRSDKTNSSISRDENFNHKRIVKIRSNFANPPSEAEAKSCIKGKRKKSDKQYIYNTVIERRKKQDFFDKIYARKLKETSDFGVNETHEEVELPIAVQLSMRGTDNSVSYQQKEDNSEGEPVTETETLSQYPFSLYKDLKGVKEEGDYECASYDRNAKPQGNDDNKGKSSHIVKRFETRKRDDIRRVSALRNPRPEIEALDEEDLETFWKARYGTPNPSIPPSSIPCGGCGALLHCQDTAVPGYLPCEIFEGATKAQLRTVVCQRCHFLKEHHVALGVNVSPDDYPRMLREIREKSALVLLLVDLLDFPCSIWPDLMNIVGRRKPIFVVGNKVDLLPKDSKDYLKKVKKNLENCLKEMGFNKEKNILQVSLISARTGFGIEDLITNLQTAWGTKGDVYIIGCTNVGKSSLFNVLLQSDFCKSQAVDIIKRATVSAWPGTTINMLKFPIIRPSARRLYLRSLRLKSEKKAQKEEEKENLELFRKTKDPKYLTLIGHIGYTHYEPESVFPRGINDPFLMEVTSTPAAIQLAGKTFNPEDPDFIQGRWCYDTPGSVHPEQIISLLTLEELQLTLPKELIKPRTFVLKPRQTFFLAGLGRIDYTEGEKIIRISVFSSSELPVSILPTDLADDFYKDNLGTDILKVPCGGPSRLKDFPQLIGTKMEVIGIDKNESCADILLSSSGWVSITPDANEVCKFVAYTPNGRGCYLRKPSLLPFAVMLRGDKLKYSPAYKNDKYVV